MAILSFFYFELSLGHFLYIDREMTNISSSNILLSNTYSVITLIRFVFVIALLTSNSKCFPIFSKSSFLSAVNWSSDSSLLERFYDRHSILWIAFIGLLVSFQCERSRTWALNLSYNTRELQHTKKNIKRSKSKK